MKMNRLLTVKNGNWTLFLDRDGVINRKIDNDYIKLWEEFEFIPGTLDALNKLSKIFNKIIIVSNQQGIGKGLMTEADLAVIHGQMIKAIKEKGGRIDKIYFCPDLEIENSRFRKPATGMAGKAKEDFPDIDFSRSVMVGDSIIDIQFGKAVGMVTVFINTKKNDIIEPDYTFANLLEFSNFMD